MRIRVSLLAGALLMAVVMGGAPAQADEAARSGSLVIIGDSITARFNDTPDSPTRGWWSIVAEQRDEFPETAAVSGSGMLMRAQCTSTTFGERLGSIAGADTVIIEGGRNDWKTCKNGKYVHATEAQTQVAIRTFMAALRSAAAKAGVDHVYVITPWGTAASSHRAFVKSMCSKWAARYGLTYIEVGYLTDGYTVDHTHPNAKGNVLLAQRVLGGMQ